MEHREWPSLCNYGELPRDISPGVQGPEFRVLPVVIVIMQVSAFPSMRPSRYGREKRKCWSQLSTGAYGRKVVFLLSCLIGTIHHKMIVHMTF